MITLNDRQRQALAPAMQRLANARNELNKATQDVYDRLVLAFPDWNPEIHHYDQDSGKITDRSVKPELVKENA